MKNFPWLRTLAALAIAGFAYHHITKEPIVYEDMNVTQAHAGIDTLDGHHLRLEGVPYAANYFYGSDAPLTDDNGTSFVLKGNEGSYVVCYSSEGSSNEAAYSRFKAFIDYHSEQENRLSFEGKMKRDYFEFKIPLDLEDLLVD